MHVTQAEFEAAFAAWKSATEEYDRMMADAMAGLPIEWRNLHSHIKELERLHQDWLIKSKRFVRWIPERAHQ